MSRDDGFCLPPGYKTDGSAGADLCAWLPYGDGTLTIYTGQGAKISTGTFIELPPGYEGQVRSKSGLCEHFGLTVLNGVGTIDSDYRGEIKVLLIKQGCRYFTISHCMSIAQLVVTKIHWALVDELSVTERGGSGFGSTGLSLYKPFSHKTFTDGTPIFNGPSSDLSQPLHERL